MVEDGQEIGEYEIVGELGGGGMATVYRAKHSFLDTQHAIKVLDPSYRAQPEARRRFLDEAKIQAKHLDHPGIVKVTNVVADENTAALVMELVEGPSLEQFIEDLETPPTTDEVLAIALPILDAVGHAHAEGIIHRDIKPANILLQATDEGFAPKVTDFGIAKVIDKSTDKSTHAMARMGTLAYMSPEQIRRAKDVTARSDVFSLGALFYELATGHIPFEGDSDYDLMENIVHGRFVSPTEHVPDLDPAVASAIVRALASDPAHRFPSCEEFAQALRGDRAEIPRIGATPKIAKARIASSKRRNLVLPVAIGLIVVVGAGAGAYLMTRPGPADSRSAQTDSPDAGASAVASPGNPDGTPGFIPVPVRDSSPAVGPADALVTLVAFLDFEDSLAFQAIYFLTEARKLYGDDVRFAVHTLPRGSNGARVARSLYAAQRQGKAWELLDVLRRYFRIDDDGLAAAASNARLDVAQWLEDRSSADIRQAVMTDAAMADMLGVTGSFAIAINGIAIDRVESTGALIAAIDEQLAEALNRTPSATYDDLIASYAPGQPEWTRASNPIKKPAPLPDNEGAERGYLAVPDRNAPSRGNTGATDTVIVFGHPAESFTKRWTQLTLPDLLKRYGDDLRIVFHFMEMPNHPDWIDVGVAALAADMQGRFWEFHDYMARAAKTDDATLVAAATAAELDIDKWQIDRTSPATALRYRADMRLAASAGITNMPTFSVNGQYLGGARAVADFAAIIDQTSSQ
jgi:serine/threonine protein kinase/protein-disulfide isomerase